MIANKFTKFLYSFLVFLLIFTTLTPSGVQAAGETIDLTLNREYVTVEQLNDTTSEVILINLPSTKKWKKSIANNVTAVINSMTASKYSKEWEAYKKTTGNITLTRVNDNQLKLTLKKGKYNIAGNQEITMNITPALIENWPGSVNPVNFTIYSKPQISLGGTIFNASATDLHNGGKTIDLNLFSAKWIPSSLETWTELSKVLNDFKVDGSTWSVINELKLTDPNKFIKYLNDNQTLRITLPPIKGAISDATIGYKINATKGIKQGTHYVTTNYGVKLHEGNPVEFTVYGESDVAVTSNLDEKTINTSSDGTIELTLQNGTWGEIDTYKKNLLIDALTPINQPEAWKKIKAELKANAEVDVADKTLIITIPQLEDYYLTEDHQLSLVIPTHLLQDTVELPQLEFTIKAEPKVFVSGSATPNITHEDLLKGEKTIELTVVNTIWNKKVASNSTNRENLLNWFDWDSIGMNFDEVKSKAKVVRTSDTTVTITLPAVAPFKLVVQGLQIIPNLSDDLTNEEIQEKPIDVFSVESTKIVSTKVTGFSGKTEFDMAKGGNTISITLTNDEWVSDIESKGTTLLSGFNITDDEENNLIAKSVVRKSNTEVLVTLEPFGKALTEDATFNLTIPADLLTYSSYPVKDSGTYKILDVKATLSGTASVELDAVNLKKGGKTIVITLDNATFKTDSSVDDLLKVISSTNPLSKEVKKALKETTANKSVVVTNNKLTFKLPAINYSGSGQIKFNIPATLLKDGQYNLSLEKDASISVGAVASVVSTTSLMDEEINKGTTLTLTLTGAKWDPTIATNDSKKAALLQGLTVADQAKEWAKVTAATKTKGVFELVGTNTLKVTIPAVTNYSIIREQKVSIKIPKSVLADYKYDIDMQNNLSITTGNVGNTELFSDVLPNLTKYINDNGGIQNIRVVVPEKKIETINVSNVEIDGTTITTIEVKTLSDVTKATVKIGNDIQEKPDGNSFIFVFTNLDPNSDVKISIFDGLKSEDIYKKVGKGNKTYNEVTKNPITGSYSLYTLLTDSSLFKDIFKYYAPSDLEIGVK